MGGCAFHKYGYVRSPMIEEYVHGRAQGSIAGAV